MATNLQLRIFLMGLVGALLALIFLMSDASGTTQEEVDQSSVAAPHAAGELLVVYESGTGNAAAEKLPKETNGEIEEEIPELDTQVVEFPKIKEKPSENQRERLLRLKKEKLKKNPAVQSVSYNFIYKAAYTPNDDKFQSQYGLKKIKAPRAWNEASGRGVDIAVVDSGVSNSHPDLRRKISAQANCTGESEDCMSGPGTAEDGTGHGTFVAGVAVASTNNREGIAGACPDCRLLAAKVLKANGEGTASDVAKGINWASNNGAEIINLSLAPVDPRFVADSPPIKKAINKARRKGAVTVAAAGNFGKGSVKIYPAAYKNVVAVAATDRSNQRASFSSTGRWVDVAAPGVGVLSTKYRTGYGRFDGTSLSSPYVAGVAGLLAAQGRSANEIRRRINSTAVDLGPRGKDASYGHGLVDAAAAVGIRNTRPKIQRPRPTPGSRVKNRRPNISAIVRDSETSLRKKNLTFILDGRKRGAFKYNATGGRLSYKPAGKLAFGRHKVKVVVRDGQGKKAIREWTFKVKTPKPRNDGPLAIFDRPGYPFNFLSEDPVFDAVRN